MQKLNGPGRSLTALEPDSTLIAVIKMSLLSWLVADIVPGVERYERFWFDWFEQCRLSSVYVAHGL